MNREQIIEQAQTMLGLLSTLDANEVAQVLGTALVEHVARCCVTSDQFLNIWSTVHQDTHNLAHDVYLANWNAYNEIPQ